MAEITELELQQMHKYLMDNSDIHGQVNGRWFQGGLNPDGGFYMNWARKIDGKLHWTNVTVGPHKSFKMTNTPFTEEEIKEYHAEEDKYNKRKIKKHRKMNTGGSVLKEVADKVKSKQGKSVKVFDSETKKVVENMKVPNELTKDQIESREAIKEDGTYSYFMNGDGTISRIKKKRSYKDIF